VTARRALARLSWAAAAWAFGYGLYRFYYAAGGTLGMLGTPVSEHQFRRINAIAGGLLMIAALLPLALANAWGSRRARPILLALCWVVAVGCASHATIGIVQRVASLTGALTIDYPFWATIDRREADLQALLFNEPWFLIEGLLWAALAWVGALRASRRRMWWVGSVLAATAVATVIGLLSAFGVIGRAVVG
jgi:hypothetical protein